MRNLALVNKPPDVVPSSLKDHQTIFYTAPVANTPLKIITALNKLIFDLQNIRFEAQFCEQPDYRSCTNEQYAHARFKDYTKHAQTITDLLLIDESDRLSFNSLEQIRDFYDQNNCGVILIGMPGLEKKLARYAQLYSRIGFVHEFRPLVQEEMLFIIKNHLEKLTLSFNPQDFTDDETLTAIIQTTRGNFRLLNRLFHQVERIMKVNQIQTITKEIIFAARECLVIGK